MIHYKVIYEVYGHASERLLMLADMCDLSEDGRKQAQALARVCSEPIGERGIGSHEQKVEKENRPEVISGGKWVI